jgi:S1-C subfamily serine protease
MVFGYRRRSLLFVLCDLLLLVAGQVGALAQDTKPRFVALFQDGTRHQGDSFSDWHDNNARPQLDGKALFDPANPMRWLIDRKHSPGGMPDAFVETFTGDRLPGTVTGAALGGTAYDPLPPHLIVDPTVALRPVRNNPNQSLPIRVALPYVRRIVFSGGGRAYRPATAFLSEDRQVGFRAARFGESSVTLLTADGPKRINFSDLIELHLPATDVWDQLLDELALLAPNGTERLIQLETDTGLIATASLPRMSVRAYGNNLEHERFIHGIQPAWALDILWVDCSEVWARRSWAANEMPLSRIEPADVRFTTSLAQVGSIYARDRNVEGQGLRAARFDFGWGIGGQSTTRLMFPISPWVRGLQSKVGLDRLAGTGGCAMARVKLDDADKNPPIWESPVMTGGLAKDSTGIQDTGTLRIPPSSSKLFLETLDAHDQRPTGADPFEIRDFVDWLDPMLLLDLTQWPGEALKRIASQSPGWSAWAVADLTAAKSDGKTPLWEQWEDKLSGEPGQFALGVGVDRPLVFSRKVSLGVDDRFLVLAASQPRQKGELTIEVRIGGERVAEFKPPIWDEGRREPAPLVVPLSGYAPAENSRGGTREIDVEIRQNGPIDSAPVRWLAIRTAKMLPTLYPIFEDTFKPEPNADVATLPKITTEMPHRGAASLVLTGESRLTARFDPPLRIRERPGYGEYRLLNLVFRKKGEGHVLVDLQDVSRRKKMVQLVFGPSKELWPEAVHQPENLTDQWVSKRIDLYASFNKIDLSELTVWMPDGTSLMLDDVFLARGHEDFRWMTESPESEEIRQAAERLAAQKKIVEPLIAHSTGSIVAIERPDGKILSGVTISPDGEILTVGHALIGIEGEFTVKFADGKQVKAKRLGVNRSTDVALLKTNEGGGYHIAGVDANPYLPPRQTFLSGGILGGKLSDGKVDFVPTDIRRLSPETIWTTDDRAAALGGGFFDQRGAVVGLYYRKSPYGGFLASRQFKIGEFLGRLRNSEMVGSWLEGAEPITGWTLSDSVGGVSITEVAAGSPAAAAGLQTGDLIKKIEAVEIREKANVRDEIAKRDPDQEVPITVDRKGTPVEVKIKLKRREP